MVDDDFVAKLAPCLLGLGAELLDAEADEKCLDFAGGEEAVDADQLGTHHRVFGAAFYLRECWTKWKLEVKDAVGL